MYKILSIDGGGIRGLIPAIWLQQLEEDAGKPLGEIFDLIAGTSTGAILAAGLSARIPAADLVEVYKKMGGEVFPRPGFTRDPATLFEWLFRPRYEDRPLGELIAQHFLQPGNKKIKLGELKNNCMIVAYDALARMPRIFRTWDKGDAKLAVADVCKGSCSAPTYFPAHIMDIDGASCPIIDGGVVANNPSSLALAHAIALNRKDDLSALEQSKDVFLLSLGTGNLTKPIETDEAKKWGPAQWAPEILDVLFDGTSSADDLACEAFLSSNSYIRFQVNLSAASERMDNASAKNINHLIADARKYLDDDPGRHKYYAVKSKLGFI